MQLMYTKDGNMIIRNGKIMAIGNATDPAPDGIQATFFGEHIGGPLDTNLSNQRISTLWPTTNPISVRLWDMDGFNPNTGVYEFLRWWYIQKTDTNTFDWGLFDRIILKMKEKGVTELLFTLYGTPVWAGGGASHNLAPTDMAYVTNFITGVANRAISLGWPIKNWEIWNEPEAGAVGWGEPDTDAGWAKLVAIGQAMYNAVKAVDPTYKVLTPAMQGSGADYWMGKYFHMGGWQYCDALAYHAYLDFWPAGTEDRFEQLIDKLRALMASYSISSKELWDTEGMDVYVGGNLNFTHPTEQAAYLAQRYLVSAAKGVNRVFWYAWDHQSGLEWGNRTTTTYQVNEVGTAHVTVKNWLLGATVSNLVISAGVYSVDITQTDGITRRAVWTRTINTAYATSFTQYETLNGGVFSVSGGTVTIGSWPILLSPALP